MATFSLRNHFLIASPQLDDSPFDKTVIYLCEHTPEGAMGIVINLPLETSVRDMLERCGLRPNSNTVVMNDAIYDGGPVQPSHGFILHERTKNTWQSSLHLARDLQVTTSKDILRAIADNKGPQHCLIALGYSGWDEGQLENELKEDSWLCLPADEDFIFEVPAEDKWEQALELLGIEQMQYSLETGHA